MRRFKQQLPEAEVRQLLTEATHGVLSLAEADGQPYGVPMSFVYDGARRLYFHCAREGRKMACLQHDGRAAFAVVAQDEIHPETFTTWFRSVLAEGRISVVEEHDEAVAALRMLAGKYAPGRDSSAEIARGLAHVAVLRFDIASVSGKEAIELTRQRCAAN